MSNDDTSEGSPLLEEAGRKQVGEDAAVGKCSGRALLGERMEDQSRRRSIHTPPGGATERGGDVSDSVLWKWRISAAAAGVVMFSIALTGLVAIFSSIQERERVLSGNSASRLWRTKKDKTAANAGEGVAPSVATSRSESQDRVYTSTRVGGEKQRENKAMSREPSADQSQSKPNVFFIMIDDMGWNDIGYQSTDLREVTPNLDKLAAGGIKMKSYYSLSVCTPARASLMTGRYPVRYGMQYDVILSGAPWGLPFSEKVFPEYMKDAGYETHMVGKWHLGSYTQDSIPSQRGFDSFMGYLNGEEMYWTHQDPSSILHGRKFYDFGFGNATGYFDIIDRPPLDPAHAVEDDDAMLSPTTTSSSSMPGDGNGPIAGQYSTQVFQDRAIAILEGKTPFDEEPLYMYLSHQAVHPPLGLPPAGCFSAEETAILDRVKANSNEDGHMRQRFAKVLMYLDRTIGDLVDYLEKEGWMENSIIVVASDNGGCYSSGGSCYPFRGNKDSYWEGGTKVPAFVYSTSHIPEERWGTEYDGMMHVTDWLPTIAAGVGMDLDGGAGSLDGINHWDSILNAEEEAGNASPRQEILYNLDPYYYLYLADDSAGGKGADNLLAKGAIRSGKYKYIMNEYCAGWYTFDKPTLEEDPLTNLETVCNGNTCSHCSGKACTGQYFDYLFDLDTDPREEHNLIEIFPEVAETLRNRMLEVAFEEWTDPLRVDIDMRSYYVWVQYNWWMVPWWDLTQGATEDPFDINSTSISTSDGLTPAASGAQ